jgi:hypothetical protein
MHFQALLTTKRWRAAASSGPSGPFNTKERNIMGKLIIQRRKRPAAARVLVGMGAFVVLALVVMLSAGNAEAAGVGPHPTKLSGDEDNSGILLAAKDTPKADASAKDARASGGKAAKDLKADKVKAPAGPPPSKFWIVNTMRANPTLVIFLTLAVGYYIGRFIFKFHPAINLGACGGARTSTASAAMVADAAKSEIPMLGYAVPYAINASLMAMLGMVIVLLY